MSSIKFNTSSLGGSDDLGQKALAVSSDDTDEESGPPMDGMAYLKQVIKERKRIADTVVADIDPGKISKPSTDLFAGAGRSKPLVAPEYTPSIRWQNQQVSEFSDARLKVTRHKSLLASKGEKEKPLKLPDKENEMLWCLFCYGKSVWNLISESKASRSSNEDPEEAKILKSVVDSSETGNPPSLRVIMSMPVHVVERVLEYQISWLSVTGWRAEYGSWFYSLLCRVEKPLHPDLGSVLRDLVLHCSQERAKLVEKSAKIDKAKFATVKNGESAKDDQDELPFDKEIAAFNLFICLVAKYFDQGDLADQ